ncbi:HRDC domain-containing protein [Amnibacterium flavum]|uniref:Ribonuclease D n=1 Tax=Amnibacterium flavum TaxID=2173173 RepID=A0A2V1HWL8_9MICO|nr:HRDC domain-containing protein [Amnibacterium flavum]PVZ94897.1 ribonuclease D [Amnibacterium flavum]
MDGFQLVETRDDYLRAVESIASGVGPVAVDAERASGFRYSQRAYLIQLHRRGSGTFLFDPPAIGGFEELQAAIGDVEWILHAASQDLTCLREVGLDPSSIFDTELAARLLGLPRVGLASVVESLLGLHLAKEHSAADWSTRPLPSSWLDYAALDVQLLPELRDRVAALLDESGKRDIAEQEFDAVLGKELVVTRADPWRRLSGLHTVKGVRALAVARELWTARDDLAQELDVSPGRLVPDASLVAAARVLPRSKRELAALREFSGRASRTELDRWWAAIERGLATEDLPQLRIPGDAMPPPRAWADRNPDADKRLKAAKSAVADVAERLDMPVENLLTPDTLRRVAWQPPADIAPEWIASALGALGARPWQIDATAQTISEAFVAGSQEAVEPEDAAS